MGDAGIATPATTAAVTRPLDLSDLAAPVFVNFSARDGLPEQVLVDVRTDREGFVWAASPQGVHRYDGRRWIASDDPAKLKAFQSEHRGASATDRDGAPVFMAKDAWEVGYVTQRHPAIRFTATKERRFADAG